MRKKTAAAGMLLIASVVLAITPAMASANNKPVLTYPTGTQLATGTKLLATNVGNLSMLDTKDAILWSCSTSKLTGTLVANSGGTFEATIEKAEVGGTGEIGAGHPLPECTATTGNFFFDFESLHWCLRSTPAMATDEFQVRGGGCSEAERKIKFSLTFTNVNTEVGEICVYEGGPLRGTFQTHSEAGQPDAIFSVPGAAAKAIFTRSSGTFLCPSDMYLQHSFTLETDTTSSSDPLYISKLP